MWKMGRQMASASVQVIEPSTSRLPNCAGERPGWDAPVEFGKDVQGVEGQRLRQGEIRLQVHVHPGGGCQAQPTPRSVTYRTGWPPKQKQNNRNEPPPTGKLPPERSAWYGDPDNFM